MKQLKAIIMTLLAVSLLAGCNKESNDDVIWDIGPIEFNIFIIDSEGHDLLDSTRQDNLLKALTLDCEGETYTVVPVEEAWQKRRSQMQTRAYMPIFLGLTLRTLWDSKTMTATGHLLHFGEFNGTHNIDLREATLRLPDGHEVTLAYSNSFRWKSDGSPDIDRHFFLDGQELTDEEGRSGVYRFRYLPGNGLQYAPRPKQ